MNNYFSSSIDFATFYYDENIINVKMKEQFQHIIISRHSRLICSYYRDFNSHMSDKDTMSTVCIKVLQGIKVRFSVNRLQLSLLW